MKLKARYVPALFAALLMALCATSIAADSKSGCIEDSIGRAVCAPPLGTITGDSIGRVVCGRGECVTDQIGRVACSRVSAGGAIVDRIGRVQCVGGCEEARPNYCVRPE